MGWDLAVLFACEASVVNYLSLQLPGVFGFDVPSPKRKWALLHLRALPSNAWLNQGPGCLFYI